MKIITLILLATLTSCVSKVTIDGQYGEYTFTPKKPIIIEPAK